MRGGGEKERGEREREREGGGVVLGETIVFITRGLLSK